MLFQEILPASTSSALAGASAKPPHAWLDTIECSRKELAHPLTRLPVVFPGQCPATAAPDSAKREQKHPQVVARRPSGYFVPPSHRIHLAGAKGKRPEEIKWPFFTASGLCEPGKSHRSTAAPWSCSPYHRWSMRSQRVPKETRNRTSSVSCCFMRRITHV